MRNINQIDETDDATINRRSYLKLTGAAATAVAVPNVAAGTATAATAGYGANGYGLGGFGTSDTPDSTTNAAPRIKRVRVSESSPPNPHANVRVDWTVSDADGDLESVSIDILDDGRTVESATVAASGDHATDTTETRIKKGAGRTYEVLITVTDSNGAEDATSTTVRA